MITKLDPKVFERAAELCANNNQLGWGPGIACACGGLKYYEFFKVLFEHDHSIALFPNDLSRLIALDLAALICAEENAK